MKNGNRNPGNYERGGGTGSRHRRAEQVGEQHGEKGTHESGRRQEQRPSIQSSEHDDDGRTQPGTGRHSQQIRIRQRIAKDPLIGRPGNRKHRTDESREDNTGNPELPKDGVLGIGQCLPRRG